MDSLTWQACAPLSCPLWPYPQPPVIFTLQSDQEKDLVYGEGSLGCFPVALEGEQNSKMRGHALLPSKPRILSNILHPKGCNSASVQTSTSHVVRSVLRRWKGQQVCCAVPLPGDRDQNTEKGKPRPAVKNSICE